MDDDCDSETDEGNPEGGAPCDTGLPGICSAGTETCQEGGLICVQDNQPTDEVCNDLDDDCDMEVDEGDVCLTEWTCNPSFYDADDGCDCGCGIVDPDCADSTVEACDYCNNAGSCNEGSGCPGTIDPVDNSQCITPWTCNGIAYNDPAVCSGHGTCVAQDECDCLAGYEGTNCDIPISCGPLSNPANGAVSYSTTTYGSTATYSCDTGYTLVGDATRTCQADGTWSGSEPVCSEDNIIFEENFSDNSAGWTMDTEWQIGPATASTGHTFGNPDPATDHTPTSDNGVAGVVIGGNAATSTHPYYYLTSPVIDTSSASTLTLEYYRWLNSDYAPYMQNQVQVFDGSSWVTIWESGSSPGIADSSWTQIINDISAYSNSNLMIRWGFRIEESGAYTVSQWNLDDVRLY